MGLLQEIASLLIADLWLLANTVLIVYPVQNWYLCTENALKASKLNTMLILMLLKISGVKFINIQKKLLRMWLRKECIIAICCLYFF